MDALNDLVLPRTVAVILNVNIVTISIANRMKLYASDVGYHLSKDGYPCRLRYSVSWQRGGTKCSKIEPHYQRHQKCIPDMPFTDGKGRLFGSKNSHVGSQVGIGDTCYSSKNVVAEAICSTASVVVILYIESCRIVLPWKMASNCEVVHPELPNNCTLNDWSEMTSVTLVTKGPANIRCDGLHGKWWIFSQQTLYPVWRPTELAAVAAGNPDRPVDGVNTIGMLLTSVKANTAAGYLGILAKDEGRDLDYYCSLACLGMRQRFRCGGVLDGVL
eukprot:Gb_02209 [translate_table: standard]